MHYADLLPELLERLKANHTKADLFITTTSAARRDDLAAILAQAGVMPMSLTADPSNRGARTSGRSSTSSGRARFAAYDVVGHVHGKRSPTYELGDLWRDFLWRHLIGRPERMMDSVVARFAEDDRLGLVMPGGSAPRRLGGRSRARQRAGGEDGHRAAAAEPFRISDGDDVLGPAFFPRAAARPRPDGGDDAGGAAPRRRHDPARARTAHPLRRRQGRVPRRGGPTCRGRCAEGSGRGAQPVEAGGEIGLQVVRVLEADRKPQRRAAWRPTASRCDRRRNRTG